MKHVLTDNDFEAITTQHFVFGRPASKISADMDVGICSARETIRTFKLVKSKDFDSLVRQVRTGHIHPNCVYWASKKLGVSVPCSQIDDAYSEHKFTKRVKRAKSEAKAELIQPEPEPKPVPDPAAILLDIANYLGLLSEQIVQLVSHLPKEE